MNPAIAITAFNRPLALQRLLVGLLHAQYPAAEVPLVISIDRGEGDGYFAVRQLAAQFDWPYGEKQVIRHDAHLGLVENVFFCGSLAEEYGGVIFLEDDLSISPFFYQYGSSALRMYGEDSCIAGLSLYALWFNGYTHQPFVPWNDGSDVFFVQVPYTIGQAWSATQWKRLREWRSVRERVLSANDPVHDMFLDFDRDDWFPLLTKYVVETGQFYVYPRMSLATNRGDIGTHFSSTTPFLEVPLVHGERTWSMPDFRTSAAVYDSFFEILPDRLNRLTGALSGLEYDVDLYATKKPRHLHSPYTLSTRRSRKSVRGFAKRLWPQEANVIEPTSGDEILLSRKQDLRWDWLADLRTRKINHDYFSRRQRLSRRTALQFALLGLIGGR